MINEKRSDESNFSNDSSQDREEKLRKQIEIYEGIKKTNYELVQTSHKSKLKLHLVLKDKSWRNGFVKEVYPDFFIFEDRENGLEPIFYLQIYKLSPYAEGVGSEK